jgi:preprotein translocase subunit SecE
MGFTESGCGLRDRRFGVAKTTPGDFIRQVRAETAKVVWPTRKETVTTTIMVGIMTMLLGVFFFGIDQIFSRIVRLLLSTLS